MSTTIFHCSTGGSSSMRSSMPFCTLLFAIIVAVMKVLTVSTNSVYTIQKDDSIYINWHKNPGTGGPFEVVFYPINDGYNAFHDNIDKDNNENKKERDQKFQTQDQEFKSGLNALKDIVTKAIKDGKRLRPYGARWSYNNQPYTNEYMVAMQGLTYAKVGIENEDYLEAPYKEKKELLVHVQGGVKIQYLYKTLFAHGTTLSTSGTTDGQTIAGAVNTGTHNAALQFGSLADSIRGIHLVIPDVSTNRSKSVFLQKQLDPVVTPEYAIMIAGADELLSNDDLFNAALVSFGTFGIVHAYLLEVEPLFKLQVQVKSFPFSQVMEGLYKLDLESLGFTLNDPSELPWHLEAIINPMQSEAKDGCMVRIMQKIPLSNDDLAEIIKTSAGGALYEPTYLGTDLSVAFAEFFGKHGLLLDFVRTFGYGLIGKTVRQFIFAIATQFVISMVFGFGGLDGNEGYPLELYGDSKSDTYFNLNPLPTIGMEPCVPLYDLEQVVPLVLKIFQNYPAPLALNIRYVKGSRGATLAPSKYKDVSVFWTMTGLDSIETRITHKLVQEALEERRDSIEYTYHWSKVLPENNEWAEKSYGTETLRNWKNERANFLGTPQALHLFSNEFTDMLGLTT